MAEYLVQGESLTTVADAIREKGGTTAPLSFPEGMAKAVRGLPSGGTDISLGITAATVGQTIKVKAVDSSGKPTAWEAVEMAGGGGSEEWELINEITLSETVNEVVIDIDSGGNPLALRLAKVECVIQIDESDPFTYIKIRCNDNTVSTNTLSNIKSGTCYFSGLYVHMGPAGIMSAVLSAVSVKNYNWKYSIEKMGFHYSSDWKATAINRLTVSPNDGQKPLGVAGTKIYVYGVRA